MFAIMQMMGVPEVSDRNRSVIGVDLNDDHLVVAEIGRSGNYVNAFLVPLVTCGKGPAPGGGHHR